MVIVFTLYISAAVLFSWIADVHTVEYDTTQVLNEENDTSILPVITYHHLTVKSGGPAVIDSVISFEAELVAREINGTQMLAAEDYENRTNSALYLYFWSSNACALPHERSSCTDTITANNRALLRRIFSRFDVLHGGKYLMDVVVYKEDHNGRHTTIAANSTHFLLTDTLNGQLLIHQNAADAWSQSFNTFSTATNITLTALITDHFSQPIYTSLWCIVGPQINVTYQRYGLSLSVLLPKSGQYKLYVAVIVHVHALDHMGRIHRVERNTSFTRDLVMKDAISKVSFVGSTTYTLGSNLSAEITCLGSPPFQIAFTLSAPGDVVIQEVMDASNSCRFHVLQPYLNLFGIYYLNITIQNEVSCTNDSVEIYVRNEAPPGVGVIVPVFAVIISIVAPATIIYSYVLDRRRQRSVESADFSFRSNEKKGRNCKNIIDSIHQIIRLVRGDNAQLVDEDSTVNGSVHEVKMKTITGSYEIIT